MDEIFKQKVLDMFSSRTSFRVAVPDGLFHADAVFCVALLRYLSREYGFTLEVYRTKDPTLLSKVDMRIGVGGAYSEATLDFDHHGCASYLYHPEGVKRTAISLLCEWCMTPVFYLPFKEKYLLGLEYQDNNGHSHPKYPSMGTFVRVMLPAYEEDRNMDVAFDEAVLVAEVILKRCFKTVEGMLKAEEQFSFIVEESIADGQILVLRRRIPIISSLHPEVAFYILKTSERYSVVALNDHVLKKSLRGLKGEQIKQATGHSGIFTHAGGLTACMNTLEGAKELCARSL